MTKNYFLVLLLLIGSTLGSCSKSDIEFKNDFEDSYDAWISFKKASGDSYSYVVTSGSWTGAGSETRIVVRGGKVVGRAFILRQSANDGTPAFEVLEQWFEDESELNTHERGAATITMDEVYRRARSEWLVKRKDVNTYFEAKNNGMISVCGFSGKNCQDDCFTGITISSIEQLADAFPDAQ